MAGSEQQLRRLRVNTLLLCVGGLIAAGIALNEWVIQTNGLTTGPSFCNISAHINCEKVNASEWSRFFGLPIGAYGLFFYSCLLLLALAAGPRRPLSLQNFANVTLLAGVVASAASIVLLLISEFVIGALCVICLVVYLVNFTLLGLAWGFGHRGRLLEGIVAGIGDLIRFLSALVGVGVSSPIKIVCAWLAVLVAVAIGFGASRSPQYFLQLALMRVVQQPGDQPISTDPRAAWLANPIITINNQFGGGVHRDYAKGDPGAPIQIVEFADFECPACRRLYVALHAILEKFPGEYQLIFRNYPLDNACNPAINRVFHKHACSAAQFSRCAGEQGKYWEAVDFLFTFPAIEGEGTSEAVKEEILEVGSRELSLDEQGIRECMASGRHVEKLRSDILEGERLGLQGTPSLWVNGRAVPYSAFTGLEVIFNSIIAGRASS